MKLLIALALVSSLTAPAMADDHETATTTETMPTETHTGPGSDSGIVPQKSVENTGKGMKSKTKHHAEKAKTKAIQKAKRAKNDSVM